MRSNKMAYILLHISIIFVSCESLVKFDPSVTQAEITINALVACDSVFEVQVEPSSITLSNYSVDSIHIPATVELYENNRFLETLAHGFRKDVKKNIRINGEFLSRKVDVYTSAIKAEAGHTYLIKATYPGLETAYAVTTIPNKINSFKIDTTEVHYTKDGEFPDVQFQITFTDEANEENFYQLISTNTFGFKLSSDAKEYQNNQKQVWVKYDHRMIYTNSIYIKPEETADDYFFDSPVNRYNIFSDELFNGKEINIECYTRLRYYIDYSNIDTSRGEFLQISIGIAKITRDQYLYLKSLDEQQSSSEIMEPVVVYSNIENGVGILGSYALNSKTYLWGIYPMDDTEYILEH